MFWPRDESDVWLKICIIKFFDWTIPNLEVKRKRLADYTRTDYAVKTKRKKEITNVQKQKITTWLTIA